MTLDAQQFDESAALSDFMPDSPQSTVSEAVHYEDGTHAHIDLFADPLIAGIREIWRSRQDMVRSQSKLTLQAKAICRYHCEGSKDEAGRLFRSIKNDKSHPQYYDAAPAVGAILDAMKPIEAYRKKQEKVMVKLGEQLPIAHMAEVIRGVNHMTLAVIVAECGDLSAYEKGIAGVWKRAGLAVIKGKRQRRVPGEEALEHGYSPLRRSVFWTLGDSLFKAQGKDENAGPYRRVYDEYKKRIRPTVETDGHAHNRAMRFMTKRLLKDLWIEWRRVNRAVA